MSSSSFGKYDDQQAEKIGQILNVYLDQRARGVAPAEDDLLAAHPEYADELREHLDLLRDLRPTATTIESLVHQGMLRESDDPNCAARLGNYKIVDYVGRGGMGIVLQALDEELGRHVALKLLRPELAEEAVALARFVREARAAAALQHPHIVTVHAIGREDDVRYIAMEFVEGTNLATRIRSEGALPPEEVHRIFREIMIALDAAHQQGLIHRDIKSSNVLLARSDQSVKLADFGLARMRDSQTQLTLGESVVGTPDYMSPEQARGSDDIDERSDLYSAGVVLFEMLTGKTPFGTGTATVTLHRILHEEPRLPRVELDEKTNHLSRIALRLLAKRPEDRFASAQAVLAALDSHAPVQLIAQRRRRLRRALAAGTILVAAAVATWGAWKGRTTADSPRGPLTVVTADENDALQLLARFGHDGSLTPLHKFPFNAGRITATALAHPANREHPIALAGVLQPVDGATLFAFDPNGVELWRRELPSDAIRWPDCGPPTKWFCDGFLVANLDGVPGDEVALLARDQYEYPSCIELIDPGDGHARQTFYHYGHLSAPRLAPNFFDDGRPALLVCGLSNKLDGFSLPRDGDPPPVTPYEWTGVAMILDPLNMQGLGPPYTKRTPELLHARPYAYGFLDRPTTGDHEYTPLYGGATRTTKREDVIGIVDFQVGRYEEDIENIQLNVAMSRPSGMPGPGHLVVNRHLEPVNCVVSSGETEATSVQFWQRVWHPLVQEFEPVDYTPQMSEIVGAAEHIVAAYPDPAKANRVLVEYADGRRPFAFAELPVELAQAAVARAEDGAQVVAIGASPALRGDGLIGFTPEGAERWRLNLTSDLEWPDCAPSTDWACTHVVAADVHPSPGEELVVVASDNYEYPTRVSLVTPADGTILSTFWHYGDVAEILVVPDMLGPGHAGLVALGVNNKLDGFYEPQPGDAPAVTKRNMAQVMMVLDPQALDGLSPPQSDRMPELVGNPPRAYGYLEHLLPILSTQGPESSSEMDWFGPAALNGLRIAPYSGEAVHGAWVSVDAVQPQPEGDPRGCAILTLDRELKIRRVVVGKALASDPGADYWRSRWHRLIPNDERAAPPRENGSSSE